MADRKTDPMVLIDYLIDTYGVMPAGAAGAAGNFFHESGLDPGIVEIEPNQYGTRGYGLGQWTGPRREQFEKFASDSGLPPHDPEIQLDFYMNEVLNNPRYAETKRVMTDPSISPAQASQVITKNYESPKDEARKAIERAPTATQYHRDWAMRQQPDRNLPQSQNLGDRMMEAKQRIGRGVQQLGQALRNPAPALPRGTSALDILSKIFGR